MLVQLEERENYRKTGRMSRRRLRRLRFWWHWTKVGALERGGSAREVRMAPSARIRGCWRCFLQNVTINACVGREDGAAGDGVGEVRCKTWWRRRRLIRTSASLSSSAWLEQSTLPRPSHNNNTTTRASAQQNQHLGGVGGSEM
jgi:hypothetical protein